MKRCPQCEFIYEDEQSLCDMDGVLLVFDSRTLPNHHALATLSSPPAKAQKRSRAVPAFATLILALVLGMVYYVSTQRSARTSTFTPASVTSTVEPATNPTPEMLPSDVNELPAPTETKSPEKEAARPVVTKPATATPVKKTATKPTATTQTKTSTEEKKDESKVGSILKKTGRILKKPFKL